MLKRGQVATKQSLQAPAYRNTDKQPYWLRHEPTAGMARVENAELIGLPENPAAFGITHVFEVGGQTLELSTEPVQVLTDAESGITKRRLEIIPPVSLHLDRDGSSLCTRRFACDKCGSSCGTRADIWLSEIGCADRLEGRASDTGISPHDGWRPRQDFFQSDCASTRYKSACHDRSCCTSRHQGACHSLWSIC
jgi:hypothetical protein